MKLLARGFSLKQLIVVLVIIVALAALMLPLMHGVRYRVLEARCRANLWAILVKYKTMKAQNNGKVDWQQFEEWLYGSPETASLRRCPLGQQGNVRSYYLLNNPTTVVRVYDRQGNSYYATRAELTPKPDKSIVVYCTCHTQPIKAGGCDTLISYSDYKVLAACDEGDGKVEYRFLYPDVFYEPVPEE